MKPTGRSKKRVIMGRGGVGRVRSGLKPTGEPRPQPDCRGHKRQILYLILLFIREFTIESAETRRQAAEPANPFSVSAHTIPVLEKAIATLKLLAEDRGATTTKALEQTLGVAHSTMYRILQTFSQEDWVRQVESGQYALSFGLLPLLQPLVRHELLIETVRDPLLALCHETGLTTKLSVRQGDFAVTLFRTESPRSTSIHVKIGTAFHLTLGSSGAVLLSALDAARRKQIIDHAPAETWQFQTRTDVTRRMAEFARMGACTDAGSYRPIISATSAPLHDRSGAVIAAITAIGFREDFEGARLNVIRRLVIATAARCDALLRGTPSETARHGGR